MNNERMTVLLTDKDRRPATDALDSPARQAAEFETPANVLSVVRCKWNVKICEADMSSPSCIEPLMDPIIERLL